MKKLNHMGIKLLLTVSLVASMSCFAEGWYIKPYVGLSSMSDVAGKAENIEMVSGSTDVKLGEGFNAGLSTGFYYNENVGVELGWEYRTNSSETLIASNMIYPEGNYASNTFFLNGLYQFDVNQRWKPYVGAGVVWVQEIDIDLESNGNELSYSGDSDIGYQAMLGVNYHMSDTWSAQFEARYLSLSDVELSGETTVGAISGLDYEPITLQLGLVYKF
ncbi:porin family protein [Alteromonas sp. KUL49]|uniref:porin family protein n=1 Tax=Alteromonas sp. KUL49 TaxID=2480798 RepID=UPI00102F071B|nr:porin family protein [Alteromonas sp. KUL49]TAP35888.1 porin family protein [Alteromonas sp. KUL49]GEA13272.1 hypothetical protein KUL49_36470 [Alteromonas sp. KUL49]